MGITYVIDCFIQLIAAEQLVDWFSCFCDCCCCSIAITSYATWLWLSFCHCNIWYMAKNMQQHAYYEMNGN